MGVATYKTAEDVRKVLPTEEELAKAMDKGSDKSIVAVARKLEEIVWTMLSEKQDFDCNKMMGTYKIQNFVSQVLAG